MKAKELIDWMTQQMNKYPELRNAEVILHQVSPGGRTRKNFCIGSSGWRNTKELPWTFDIGIGKEI